MFRPCISKPLTRTLLCLLALLLGGPLPAAASASEIRVATLKFGTLNWELTTIQQQGLDHSNGFALKVLPMAGMTATRTALESGAADVVVADWLWVNRQRAMGDKLQFIPYSSSIGKVMLAKGSGIHSLADLRGKRIGVADGPLGKGWLLLRALGLKQGIDLQRDTEQKYGAPPLLNVALERGQIDALITFWHFAAKLEAHDFPVLYNLKDVSRQLGMDSNLPMLGYVFHQDWAQRHPDRVAALQRASSQAKAYLHSHDEAWQTLRPLMKASDDAVFRALKNGFLAGTPAPLSSQQLQDAGRMFDLMARLGGKKLVGDSRSLDPVTFWRSQEQ